MGVNPIPYKSTIILFLGLLLTPISLKGDLTQVGDSTQEIMILFGFIDHFYFFTLVENFCPSKVVMEANIRDPKKKTKQAVCHRVCGLAIYIKKYLKAKEKRITKTQYISPCKNIIFKKIL